MALTLQDETEGARRASAFCLFKATDCSYITPMPQRLDQHILQSPWLDRVHLPAALRTAQREKRSGVPFTEWQLTAIRGGLTAEEYRWKLIREFSQRD